MRARDIESYERDFRRNGRDSDGKTHSLRSIAVSIPGDAEKLNVVVCQPANGDRSYYYKDQPVKQRVVIHFTAGYLKGDVATLTKKDYHVSVPFLVARDGTIYNLFSSKNWSYHLGPGAKGGNKTMSKSSIGIEISNIGPLTRSGNNLNTIYGQTYCSLDERQFYDKKSYRNYDYYATYTDAQYKSLVPLLRYATGAYHIPRQFLNSQKRYNTLDEITQFFGVTSHVNFRSDKYDIGPAFDWNRVISGVTA